MSKLAGLNTLTPIAAILNPAILVSGEALLEGEARTHAITDMKQSMIALVSALEDPYNSLKHWVSQIVAAKVHGGVLDDKYANSIFGSLLRLEEIEGHICNIAVCRSRISPEDYRQALTFFHMAQSAGRQAVKRVTEQFVSEGILKECAATEAEKQIMESVLPGMKTVLEGGLPLPTRSPEIIEKIFGADPASVMDMVARHYKGFNVMGNTLTAVWKQSGGIERRAERLEEIYRKLSKTLDEDLVRLKEVCKKLKIEEVQQTGGSWQEYILSATPAMISPALL